MEFFLLFLLIAVVVIICSSIAAKKRYDAMTALAAKLGLQFSGDKDYQLVKRYAFLEALDRGSKRHARNILSGRMQGHEVLAFDFHYETYSRDTDGNRKTRHHQCAFFILHLPASFPELIIAPEGLFSKMAQAMGFEDIDFESHAFSSRYVVKSKDKKFAYDFCNAQMIDYLLDQPALRIEVDHNALAIAAERSLHPEQIEDHLNKLIEIRNRMPNYLFDQTSLS